MLLLFVFVKRTSISVFIGHKQIHNFIFVYFTYSFYPEMNESYYGEGLAYEY